MTVSVCDNALTYELIQEVRYYPKTQTTSECSYTSWSEGIVKASTPVLVYALPIQLQNKIESEVKKVFPELEEFQSVTSMVFHWTVGSYIPWHSDHSHKFGVTVYLNEYWDKDWGGYFAYELDGIHSIKPEFNRATKILTPLEHTVFRTNPDAPIRETIQIFGH